MTKRATTHWRVSEYPSGPPFIVLEPLSGDTLATFQRTIGFDLPDGTTIHEAKEIAAFLRLKLHAITET